MFQLIDSKFAYSISGSQLPQVFCKLSYMKNIGDRIRARRKELGLTQAELAKRMGAGASRESISQWENSIYTPEADNLFKLASALGVNARWLLGGKEEQKPADAILPVTVWDAPEDLDPEQSVIVPRVDVKFAAGNGRETSFEPTNKDQGNAYRMEWIRARKLDPKRLICIYVTGDSMAPSLPSGSVMTTDTRSDTLESVVPGKVYAIRYGNELRIKRLSWRYDGALLIDSDNPAYKQEVVEPAHLEHIGVIGRYVAHSYDGEI